MNIRFNTAAGFLAAATLLSGSAFAFAPEFTGDLPTVIITDQLAAPSTDFDLAQPGNVTSGIFRFTGAFDLYDYINGGQLTSSEKAAVRWAFTESKDGVTVEPAAAGTLIINDEESLSDPPTSSELATGALLGTSGLLNFWNKDFSGSNTTLNAPPVTPFDYLSDITTPVHDLVASGPQERIVTIYVKGDAAAVDLKSFTVITKIGEGDSISAITTGPATGPVDPFVDVVATTNDFAGWTQFSLDFFIVYFDGGAQFTALTDASKVYLGGPTQPNRQVPAGTVSVFGNPGVTAGHQYTPAASPAAAATTSLTAAVSGSFAGPYGSTPKIGLSSWERVLNVTVDANSVYRVRTALARSSAALRESYRIRVGDSRTYGSAITLYNTVPASPSGVPFLGTSAADHYTYLVARASSSNSTMQVNIEAYSLGDLIDLAGVGSGIVLSELEISAAERADLGTPNVLFNRGGTIPALASGEPDLSPGAAAAALSLSATPAAGAVRVSPVGATTAAQPRSSAISSGALNLTLGAATGGPFPRQITMLLGANASAIQIGEGGWTWASIVEFSDPVAAGNPASTGLFPVAADKLYITDVYLSSAAANTALATMPTLRIRTTTGGLQESQVVYELNGTDGPGIATSPKVYSLATRTNGLAGVAGTQAHLFIDFYQSGVGSDVAISNVSRTITIHRVVVSEYDFQ